MVKEKNTYSRRSKYYSEASVIKTNKTEETQTKNIDNLEEPPKKEKNFFVFILLLLISLLVSLSFNSFPIFNEFYSGLKESINNYSGFAMNNGQMPYRNFYSNDGPIFFLINELGNKFGNTWILWGVETLNLIFVSNLIYKIGRSHNISTFSATFISILSIIGVAVAINGGNLAAGFAIYPILLSIDFIDKIFNNQVDKDSKFIIFGSLQAISVFITPAMLLVNILFFVFFFIKFLKEKPVNKQKIYSFIYRILSYIFGFLIIFYLTIYYGLINQFLVPAAEQMFILPFQSIRFDSSSILNLVVSLILLLLIFGKQLVYLAKKLKSSEKGNLFYKFIILASLLYFILTVLSPMYVVGDLVILLPLFLIPILNSHNQEGEKSSVLLGVKSSFLPLLGILVILAYDVYTQVEKRPIFEEESRVASFIHKNTNIKDRVLVLSDDYNIYVNSKRLATLPIPLNSYPEIYKKHFTETLPKTESKFIIENKNYDGVGKKSVNTELDSSYALNKKFKSNDFEIYERIGSDDSLIDDKNSNKNKGSSKEKTESSSSSSENINGKSDQEIQSTEDAVPDQQYNNTDPNQQYNQQYYGQ
ncbi:hypothetical protein BG262_01265 [Floricoccus penangensis]|uniref:Uncharacterized protein n=1 Tax=Floricoccus penangensis TaxID=1859475 RepID=A0A9Q5JGN8_9LACT|nr:hypothetical protein [Floricoccus penangensis]OFI46990.1 hypothetical protein BG262_01265 [Floricoccus penangensis]